MEGTPRDETRPKLPASAAGDQPGRRIQKEEYRKRARARLIHAINPKTSSMAMDLTCTEVASTRVRPAAERRTRIVLTVERTFKVVEHETDDPNGIL